MTFLSFVGAVVGAALLIAGFAYVVEKIGKRVRDNSSNLNAKD